METPGFLTRVKHLVGQGKVFCLLCLQSELLQCLRLRWRCLSGRGVGGYGRQHMSRTTARAPRDRQQWRSVPRDETKLKPICRSIDRSRYTFCQLSIPTLLSASHYGFLRCAVQLCQRKHERRLIVCQGQISRAGFPLVGISQTSNLLLEVVRPWSAIRSFAVRRLQ